MNKLRFVVQLHKATTLHYDFRLEHGGVMPSWAIPKGPSLDPLVKRLAMKVEDHSLEYRNFEGMIEEGSYGAGPVIVWDEGEYTVEKEEEKGLREKVEDLKEAEKVFEKGLKKGELKFILAGKKLKGSFALIKTKGFPPGSSKDTWLLIKHKDQHCLKNYNIQDFNYSIKSGKKLEEI